MVFISFLFFFLLLDVFVNMLWDLRMGRDILVMTGVIGEEERDCWARSVSFLILRESKELVITSISLCNLYICYIIGQN